MNAFGTHPVATQLPRGFLADNVLHFVRVLRAAGLPLGPAKVIDAITAVEAVGVANKTDFREALAAVLVSRHDQLMLFEQAFDLFWRNPKLLEKMLAALLPRVYGRLGDATEEPELPSRLAQAMLPPKLPELRPNDEDEVELDAAFTFSPREILQTKDFATMTTAELAQVKVMLARLKLPLPELPVRRTRAAPRGHRIDLRATMRGMTGAAGPVAPLAFRTRVRRPPPLVVLCDISGSMDRYARMLLHFLHAITNDRHRVHTLLFGTRLTNITRHLKHRDVDVAIARVTESVNDWAGGTRIGACIGEFNRRWSRRLLGQNAVVLLISDGLDAESGVGLEFEVERLARSCARLIWLNPLLRYAGFEARPAGIRAILPHVDDFLPVHNLASLTSLATALSGPASRGRAGVPLAA
ncbi:MAG: VWA domain-containing protein [Betaproteobacteria bacterium]